jgi:hypothetical protein
MKISRAFVVLTLLTSVLALGVAPASAIDKCKVKVDKKTGVIYVDAAGVGGPLTWGEEAGSENNTFFNAGTCVTGPSAKKCQLANPTTLASKTAPEGCTIYLADTVLNCSAWIPGCSPGAREDSGAVVKDANGVYIGNLGNQYGTSAIRNEGGIVIDLPLGPTVTGFQNTGFLNYLSNDCSGTPLLFAQTPIVAATSIEATTAYIPPTSGTLQAAQSYKAFSSFTTNQGGCDSYYGPGSTHVPPLGCCFVSPFNGVLGNAITLDLSVFTPPFVADVD